ncbi:MAG: hypothetical protein MHM6MM_003063 [Cercozoa sp. M6MM]
MNGVSAVGRAIGEGAQSQVFAVSECTVEKHTSCADIRVRRSAEREVLALRVLEGTDESELDEGQGPILKLRQPVCRSEGSTLILRTERCECNLRDLLRQMRQTRVHWRTRMSVTRVAARTLARSLMRLHACGLVHGDVCDTNVFIRSNGSMCLGDYGAVRLQTYPEAEQSNKDGADCAFLQRLSA